MLPLKLLRSLLLLPHSDPPALPPPLPPPLLKSKSKKIQTKATILVLVFTPTNEAIADTYRLASLARDIGLDLSPTPTLSHIIFSLPNSSQSFHSHHSPAFSFSLCLQNGAVPLPFPALYSASLAHLRAFVSLSKSLFKLVKVRNGVEGLDLGVRESVSYWERCGLGLYCRRSGVRVEGMDGLCGAMAGAGWSVFKSGKGGGGGGGGCCGGVFLFRKVEVNRVGDGRERELRLPFLDFENAPLRIFQYVVLMTDDVLFLS